MYRIIHEIEQDPAWRSGLDVTHGVPQPNTPDAICCALRRVASLLDPAATVAYTASGFSALRASRERPPTPILALTPDLSTARRLALASAIHPIPFDLAPEHLTDLLQHATSRAVAPGMAHTGNQVMLL